MMLTLVILACVAISVAGVIYAVSQMVSKDATAVETRLEALTRNNGRGAPVTEKRATLLKDTLEDRTHALETFVAKFLNLRTMLYLAGWKMDPIRFILICLGSGGVCALLYLVLSPFRSITPFVFGFGVALPLLYLMFMKKRRMKKFGAQLPEALDLIGQALRAGQSLPAGLQLVAQQTEDPLGPEFLKCFEQQNLGVPLEQALMEMTDRVPNMDLQFFVTSVALQRQTGGDLAEILDKIAKLIRERFVIWGQIQSLTGEGRLSGIVLLVLPPALFLAMLKLNYDYIMMLFNEPLGQKMLIFAIVMQFFGALAIKKIITIKV
jgi:tight adherence protein B